VSDVHVLDSAKDYYSTVLKPNNDEFFATSSNFRTALNLATSLFHFHEWMFEYHRADLEKLYGRPLPNKGEFWGVVESADKRFGFIRDLANAAKHVRLKFTGRAAPSTSMTHIANTSIQVTGGFDVSAFDTSAFDAKAQITMKDGMLDVHFERFDCNFHVYRSPDFLLGSKHMKCCAFSL
jgi:hypothetical protein